MAPRYRTKQQSVDHPVGLIDNKTKKRSRAASKCCCKPKLVKVESKLVKIVTLQNEVKYQARRMELIEQLHQKAFEAEIQRHEKETQRKLEEARAEWESQAKSKTDETKKTFLGEVAKLRRQVEHLSKKENGAQRKIQLLEEQLGTVHKTLKDEFALRKQEKMGNATWKQKLLSQLRRPIPHLDLPDS